MCQREEKVLPCEIGHMPLSCIRANCPNRCQTEICVLKCAGRLEGTSGARSSCQKCDGKTKAIPCWQDRVAEK